MGQNRFSLVLFLGPNKEGLPAPKSTSSKTTVPPQNFTVVFDTGSGNLIAGWPSQALPNRLAQRFPSAVGFASVLLACFEVCSVLVLFTCGSGLPTKVSMFLGTVPRVVKSWETNEKVSLFDVENQLRNGCAFS